MGNHKNAELKEILLKRKAKREQNAKLKLENISITKAEKFRAKKELELELQKRNNPNFRDYDKEPLIIKCYDDIFWFYGLISAPFIFSLFLCAIFSEMYSGDLTLRKIIAVIIVPLLWIIYIYIKHKSFRDYKIKFTNMYIEFIHKGKIRKSCPVVENELIKPFFTFAYNDNNDKIFLILLSYIFKFLTIVIFFVIGIANQEPFVFLFPVFIYLVNFLIKFVLYISINGHLKGFKFYCCIRVCEQHNPAHWYKDEEIYGAHLIYLYNNAVYDEVKKYFLQRNINIDNLPKRYFNLFEI